MAIRTQQIGKNTHVHVEFGKGDIAITVSREEGSDITSMLFLTQDKPKPESEWRTEHSNDFTNLRSSDVLADGGVVLKFNKAASISILIDSLTDIKNSMLEFGL